MATKKKSFRIDEINLNFLQLFQEKRGAKSLNEALNLILDFLSHNVKLNGAIKEKFPLLEIKCDQIDKENRKEIKIFMSHKEFEIIKRLCRENGFSSVNKFCKFIVLSHFSDDKILSEDTINEFAKVNNQIRRVGINLGIFLKAIQQNEFVYFKRGAIDEWGQQIKIEADNVSKFIQEQKRILREKLK